MLAQGAYQVDSTSERIKLGLARGNGKKAGRPPALTQDRLSSAGGWLKRAQPSGR